MKSDYEKLLDKAISQLPESVLKKERFEIPKAIGHIEGNKTIISNFIKIAQTLRREPAQLLKYLQRELASPAVIEDTRLVLKRRIRSELVNEKIKKYTEDFVLCPECKKPDTILKKENRVLMIKCMACGAKHPVKSKI
jgi:translation initiation factor 2 subunit 2